MFRQLYSHKQLQSHIYGRPGFWNSEFTLTIFLSVNGTACTQILNMDVASQLIRCANFAAIKHKDQRRKDAEKTPYINHPIGMFIKSKDDAMTSIRICI